MSIFTSGLWKQAPNTKLPAISHYFSFRISPSTTNLAAGTGFTITTNGTYAFALPANYSNVGQNAVVTGSPSSSAPTASAYDPNSEPQYGGAIFVPTMFCVRNMNGLPVTAGTSAAGSATISLYNPNISAVNNLTGVVTRSSGTAINASNTLASMSWTASTTGLPLWTTESVFNTSVGAVATTAFAATAALTGTLSSPSAQVMAESATSAPGIALTQVKFGLGDSLAVAVVVASYAVGGTTAATLTAFTADVFGYWIQGI